MAPAFPAAAIARGAHAQAKEFASRSVMPPRPSMSGNIIIFCVAMAAFFVCCTCVPRLWKSRGFSSGGRRRRRHRWWHSRDSESTPRSSDEYGPPVGATGPLAVSFPSCAAVVTPASPVGTEALFLERYKFSPHAVYDKDAMVGLARLEEYGHCDDVCPICLDCFARLDSAAFLPCSHPVHTECLQLWLSKCSAAKCPVCHSDLRL